MFTGTVFEKRTWPASELDFLWICFQELWENEKNLSKLPIYCAGWRVGAEQTVIKKSALLEVFVDLTKNEIGIRYRKGQ